MFVCNFRDGDVLFKGCVLRPPSWECALSQSIHKHGDVYSLSLNARLSYSSWEHTLRPGIVVELVDGISSQ